ncbi:hypothetical protein BKA70DRAFT_282502 [Coprinopsis sp. MPI-PUGE-AT-0042]|nr:hypothetical protein BKA70DRAFT_282502 [Coprinopsis sp. MPI-PUGE-AT-0042]
MRTALLVDLFQTLSQALDISEDKQNSSPLATTQETHSEDRYPYDVPGRSQARLSTQRDTRDASLKSCPGYKRHREQDASTSMPAGCNAKRLSPAWDRHPLASRRGERSALEP